MKARARAGANTINRFEKMHTNCSLGGIRMHVNKLRPDREETEITGFIAEAIQARLNSPEIDETI